MEIRVMSMEEKDKLRKENFETEEKKKEVVVNDLFRNEEYSLVYVEDTYRLEKKYQDNVPHRLTLFRIFNVTSLNICIGIDAVLATGAIQLYGDMLTGKNNLVIYPHIETNYTEENYNQTRFYKSLADIINFTSLTDKERFLKEIIMTLKGIVNQLSLLSYRYNHHSAIIKMSGSDLKKNFEFLMSKTPQTQHPYFTKEIEINICTPDNVVYPLYYQTGYKENDVMRRSLPNTITPNYIVYEKKEITLAREDKYDLLERDLLLHRSYHNHETKNIIPADTKNLKNYNSDNKDRLAINMIKQLPTHIVELALALKRIFGNRTTMSKGENGKGIGIYNSDMSLVVKLFTSKSKDQYYNVEYRNSTESYSFLIDSKDLIDVLRIMIKYHNNEIDVLKSDLILIHEYITTNITPTIYDYDFWYSGRGVNDSYDLTEYNDEEEEEQCDLVKYSMLDDMRSLVKYGKFKNDHILYNLDVNNTGELFVLVFDYAEDVMCREISGIVKRKPITEIDYHNKDLHGSVISFKVCLEDETIVFNPIKNNICEQYTENIQGFRSFEDEDLKEIIEPVTEGIFMDMIHKYIEYCKELDMADVFEIK